MTATDRARPVSSTIVERPLDAGPSIDDAERRAVAAERRVEALERALASRATIDQAKGVIMGTFGLSADSAFEVLTWVSQHANVKLATIAEHFLADVHDLDLGDPPRDRLTRLLAALAGCETP